MPHVVPIYAREDFGVGKILAVVIIVIFLIFALNIVRLWPYLNNMERAAEETSRLVSEQGTGPVSIIQGELIPEIRLIFILSLIFFGLLDGIFAFILWKEKIPGSKEKIALQLVIIYAFNRFVSTYIMSILPTMILVGSNSRPLMRNLYMTIPIFSAISVVIILLIKKVVFQRKKGTKILFKIS